MPVPLDPLPFRQETFLAHYPRKLKLAVTGVVLAALLAPLLMGGGQKATGGKGAGDKPAVTALSAAPQSEKKETAAESKPVAAFTAGVTPEHVAYENDTDDHNKRMTRAPDPGITDDTPEGSLPRISEDGRKPWQVYARPFNTLDKRPRIAIVVQDLGLSRVSSDAAIQRLPSNVTLAFDAQGPVVGSWMNRAREDGHETLLALPMEPFDYPRSDPGVNTMLTNLPNSDNLQRLYWSLRRGLGFVGVTTFTGSRFTADPNKTRPILEALKQRGLLVFEANVAPHSTMKDLAREMHMPVAISTQPIDQNSAPEAIDKALRQLEQTARLTGRAIGVASSLPVTLEHLETWIKQLPSQGIALAPLSAMVE